MKRRWSPKNAAMAIVALFLSNSAWAEWKQTPMPAIGEAATSQQPVWYRCFIRVPDNLAVPAEKDLMRDSVLLHLGGINGPFSVLLDGQKIVDGKAIKPGERERFKVPKDILVKKAFNVLAIRL